MPAERRAHVWRLDIKYPPGSQKPGWEPADWDPWPDGLAGGFDADGAPLGAVFRWPRRLRFLSASGAKKQADLFRKYGAEVTVERSAPVEWPQDQAAAAAGDPDAAATAWAED